MTTKRKEQISILLKGIETGDPDSVAVVNEAKYIQHNPLTLEGSEGLAELFARLSKTNPRVNIVRVFADGDYVFAHTEYNFTRASIGFEVFRFEDGFAVEHWDNIQQRFGPNPSGHSMVDGVIEPVDIDKTESNRTLVKEFVNNILIEGNLAELGHYIDDKNFIEHNPRNSDGLAALRSMLTDAMPSKLKYNTVHQVLAEGNFVLCICEGYLDGVHTSLFDLFRVVDNKVVEHWDTVDAIAPRAEWKNQNGKFGFPK